MLKKSEQDIKQGIIDDVRLCNDSYKEWNPSGNIITRDYYRDNGNHKEKEITKHFGSFATLLKEAFPKDEIDLITYKKRIHILENENKNLKTENTELIKGSVLEDELVSQYRNSLENEILIKINNSEIAIKDDKERVALLHLSDWHVGEEVNPLAVNGVNEYNEQVCLNRLDTTFNVFIAYCKKFNITNCHLLLNGDNISGGIHEELTRNSWLNEVEQIFFFQKYIIKKMEYFSQFFNRIDISCIVGNHSRILQGKPYYKDKVKLNFEYILGKNIQAYFELLQEKKLNNKIFVDVPEGAFKILKINNTKFLATHGDILTGAGGGGFAGIPFYSICQSSAKLYGVLHQIDIDSDTKFDHCIVGHLHTTAKIPLFNGGFCYVNGCGIGTNEFSLVKMKSVAKLSQLMLIIDKNGRIELEKDITFD